MNNHGNYREFESSMKLKIIKVIENQAKDTWKISSEKVYIKWWYRPIN